MCSAHSLRILWVFFKILIYFLYLDFFLVVLQLDAEVNLPFPYFAYFSWFVFNIGSIFLGTRWVLQNPSGTWHFLVCEETKVVGSQVPLPMGELHLELSVKNNPFDTLRRIGTTVWHTMCMSGFFYLISIMNLKTPCKFMQFKCRRYDEISLSCLSTLSW